MHVEPPILQTFTTLDDVEQAHKLQTKGAEADACQAASAPTASASAVSFSTRPNRRWYAWPGWCVGRAWDVGCLCVLLAVVAAVPVVQLASLGYLLHVAARLAQGKTWSEALPGTSTAGSLGRLALLASLLWLPVWFISDLSYSAQLLLPGSETARNWRLAALGGTLLWTVWVGWAALRGAKLRYFVWPAPVQFAREIFLMTTWRRASDALYEWTSSLRFLQLWWLGARAAVGAGLWLVIPASMMIIGERADNYRLSGVVGLIGALGMICLVLYLPFLQINMAIDNRLAALWDVPRVRRQFAMAPGAYAFSLWLLCILCIPLYLLRIEATPAEFVWAPSLVFVLLMLPAKLALGAAMGYAHRRQLRPECQTRHWTWCWSARVVGLASALLYVGALYVAQLVAGQGAWVMYFQHAFMVPAM
jgi:hypothetical protein